MEKIVMENHQRKYEVKEKKGNVVLGVFLIVIGVSIFFPEIISIFLFKIVIALLLVWTGLKLIFNFHR